jgi:hypothetical protein
MLYYQDRLEFASNMPAGIVAEIGVQWGKHASIILEQCRPTKLYLIDCWEFQPGVYEEDPADVRDQNPIYQSVLDRFANVPSVEIRKMYSLQAASTFPDEYFDWVYIDANHSRAAVWADMKAWWPKVKTNGYLCGHDYINIEFIQVKRTVDEFCATYHAKLHALTREKLSSWAIKKYKLFK